MTKALTFYGTDNLKLANGKEIDWRRRLFGFMGQQDQDSSWINEDASLVGE